MSVRPQLTTWESRPDCELAVLSSALCVAVLHWLPLLRPACPCRLSEPERRLCERERSCATRPPSLSRVAARAACETRSNAAAIASAGSRLCEPASDPAGEEPEPHERPLFDRSSALRTCLG